MHSYQIFKTIIGLWENLHRLLNVSRFVLQTFKVHQIIIEIELSMTRIVHANPQGFKVQHLILCGVVLITYIYT